MTSELSEQIQTPWEDLRVSNKMLRLGRLLLAIGKRDYPAAILQSDRLQSKSGLKETAAAP